MLFEMFILFGAGFLGGVFNALAGGGSFITFPALLLAGVPPISANATNTFASCAGYLSGTYAFREELAAHKKKLPQLILISLVGGFLGAWLLLQTPESLFRKSIPWLLLLAAFFFLFGEKISNILQQFSAQHRHAPVLGQGLLFLMLLGVSVYGGFFNAGLGIVALSYLSLAGYSNINVMNGIKLLISFIVSLTAIALFSWNSTIFWSAGGSVLVGSLFGGYTAASLSKYFPQHYVKAFIIIVSCGITAYFFIDTY